MLRVVLFLWVLLSEINVWNGRIERGFGDSRNVTS